MNRGDSTGALVAALLGWITAAAAALLAVSTQPWAQTLLVALLGLLYLLVPPRQAMPWPIVVLGALLMLVGLTAFLPAGGFDPGLRAALRDHGIALASTRSLQPWRTLEDLVLVTSGLFWGWACLRVDLAQRQRETLVDGYLGVLGVIALGVLLHGRLVACGVPPWLAGLGQFANRNQTGDILVAGGIFSLARAFSHLTQRAWTAVFWFGLALLFVAAIVENDSRAAVLLFALGSVLLVAWRMLDRPSAAVAGSALALLGFGAMMAVAATGFAVVHRFGSLFATGGSDGRIAIYRDAATVVGHAPWLGFGLGNFEGVFNVLREHSAAP